MFSGLPVQCDSYSEHTCYCHYLLTFRANVYNCSHGNEKRLPPSVPHGTNWFLLQRNHIFELNSNFEYLSSIWFLDLKFNNIRFISDTFIDTVKKGTAIKWLDLSDNNLARIPSTIQKLTFLEKVWLDGNPFHCDCSMTWMIGWLNNFTTPKGQHIIVDYKDIYCQSGRMKDLPIYVLNEVTMGCYRPKLTTMQKIGIGLGAGVALVIILVILLVSRNPREVKFLMYYYFKLDTVPKDDKNENVDNMDYDAFFCYRSVYY